MKLRTFGPLFIIIAAVLWSLDGLLRRSLYVLPPIIIVFYEHFLGFIVLTPFLLKAFKEIQNIDKRVWGAFVWITLLSSILGTVLYTAALGQINYIQFSVVVLLQQMQPLFVVFFAWLVLKERLTRDYFLWFFLALVGAYFVSFPTLTVNLETGRGTIIAALFAIGAAFSWGSSTAFSRYALLRLSTVVTTGLRMGLAAFIAFLLIIVFGQQGSLSVSTSQITTLLVITFSTGMVALLIYYYGLKRTPAYISAICELTWPLSAILIDYLYYHKGLTLTQWIGTLLLLTAITQVSLKRRKYAQEKKKAAA